MDQVNEKFFIPSHTIFLDNPAIIIYQSCIFQIRGLNGIQMKGCISQYVNNRKSTNIQPPFSFFCTTRPKITCSKSGFPAFRNVTWIKSYDAFFNLLHGNEYKIEFLEIEPVLEIDSEILFAIFGKTRKLQKIYLTFDAQIAHQQAYNKLSSCLLKI